MTTNIINEDCLESNKHIQPNSVDLFFTDPPYFTTGIYWDNQWKNNTEYYDWCKVWIQNMHTQLRDTGSAYVCCQWPHSGQYQVMLQDAGFVIQNRITWKKDKGKGSNSNWKQMHEDIWFVTKSKNYTFNIDDVKEEKKVIAPYRDEEGNPKDWWIDENGNKVRLTHPGNLWEKVSIPFWSSHEVKSYAKSKKSPDNIYEKHNTQKPKDLVAKCIIASSNPGDLVADYFGGSGTTAVACKETNREYILFEMNKTYCDIIKTRLQNEKPSEYTKKYKEISSDLQDFDTLSNGQYSKLYEDDR
tara:strand:+ start:64 stop:966 length:903 start_codon:yes stop_codon:yes gene_type:complete